MTFLTFRDFVQHAPIMLKHLLVGAGRPGSEEMCSKVRRFFELLDPMEAARYMHTCVMHPKRLLELALASELEADDTSLPLVLYHVYLQRLAETRDEQLTDEEMRFWITHGRPIEYFCVITCAAFPRGSIYTYCPDADALSFLIVEQEGVSDLFKAYLRRLGQEYGWIEQALSAMRQRHTGALHRLSDFYSPDS